MATVGVPRKLMENIRAKLRRLVGEATSKAVADGALPALDVPEDVGVERPQNPDHGDFATNIAMKLARTARMSPLEIARLIAERLPTTEEIASAQPAPPGFINISLSREWLKRQVETVLAEGDTFGNVDVGKGARVQVEFVSVNPTGPVHIGHGRGAVLGSTLANVLEAAGYQVQREYYVNDAGNQMEIFNRSLYARAAEAIGMAVEFPEGGYVGGYLKETARALLDEAPDPQALRQAIRERPDEALVQLAAAGLEKMLALIREDLEALGVRFDVWFRERSLFDSGEYDATIRALTDGGHLGEKDGASWFLSSRLGEEKDNVVVRSNGTPTYFASDIAYHRNKFLVRGFDRVIDLWGADHQGHISRMKAAMRALGIDPERLTILTSQLVTLKRGDQVLRISKRTGDIITLREVIDEVGADVCRFFLLARSADSQMDFDLELAKTQSQENPVYYVQYAHARIASIFKLAVERGVDSRDGDVSLLDDDAELALIRKMLELPELVEQMAGTLAPHHLPHYAQELATAFHWFYKQCRVISPDEALTGARLRLVDAARVTLARTLSLMGMSAPEEM